MVKLPPTIKAVATSASMVALVAIAAVVALPNQAQLHALVQDQLREASGREVSIGALTLNWWTLSPRLRLDDVAVASPDWATHPELARIGQIALSIEAMQLLEGKLRVSAVQLRDVDLYLQRNTNNQGNWGFSVNANQAGEHALDATFNRLEVERLQAHFVASQATRTLQIQQFKVVSASNGRHSIDAAGEFENHRWKVNGQATTLRAWLRGVGPTKLQLSTSVAALNLKLDGTLSGSQTQLDLKLDGRLPSDPSNIDSISLDGPLLASAKLHGNWPEYVIDELKLRLADNRLSANLTIDLAPARPRLTGSMQITALDPNLFSAAAGRATGNAESARLLPKTKLPSYTGAPLDVDVLLRAATLPTNPPLTNLRVRVRAGVQRLALTQLTADLGRGSIRGDIELPVKPHLTAQSMQIQLRAKAISITALTTAANVPTMIDSQLDADINVDSHGDSIAEFAGNASGAIDLLNGSGRAESRAAETLTGGLHALGDLFTTTDSDSVKVNCGVAAFELRNGTAQARALVLDTQRTTVTGEGSINLRNERLALLMKPHPKSATLNLSVPVRLVGTLAAPAFELDEAATARRVGGVVAGLVFPPALLSVFADLGYNEASCLPAQAAGNDTVQQMSATLGATAQAVSTGATVVIEGAAQAAVQGAGEAAQAVEKAVGRALKEVDNSLKSLFSN